MMKGSMPYPIQFVIVDSSCGVIEKYVMYEKQYQVLKCIAVDNVLQDTHVDNHTLAACVLYFYRMMQKMQMNKSL